MSRVFQGDGVPRGQTLWRVPEGFQGDRHFGEGVGSEGDPRGPWHDFHMRILRRRSVSSGASVVEDMGRSRGTVPGGQVICQGGRAPVRQSRSRGTGQAIWIGNSGYGWFGTILDGQGMASSRGVTPLVIQVLRTFRGGFRVPQRVRRLSCLGLRFPRVSRRMAELVLTPCSSIRNLMT